MPDKDLTPAEIELNRQALRHVSAWLRFRDLTQRRLAEMLGVSEPTISKWLKGVQPMKIGQFVAVARILNAKPEELLLPPCSSRQAEKYKQLAEIVEGLSEEDLANYIAVGRAMQRRE